MKIDRSLFLLLTGAIAGSACYINTQGPGSQPPPTPSAAPSGTTAEPAPSVSPTARRLSKGHLGRVGTPSSEGPEPPPPSVPPPTDPPAGACLDSAPAATSPTCEGLAPDASCAPFAFVGQKCAAYNLYFKPKVAAQAVSCMKAFDGKALCSAGNTYTCGKNALLASCPDANVATACTQIAATCKDTAANCSALLSGLNAAGLQKVSQCAVADGCKSGLYSCVEGLMGPSAEGAGGTKR